MKKVCIILPDNLPVPATKGGAIETLITNLINRNEVEKKLDLTIISIYEKKAEEEAKKYKYTTVKFISQNTKRENMIFFVHRVLRKTIKWHIMQLNPYVNKVYKYLQDKEFDYVINEGLSPECFHEISKLFGRNKTLYHIHSCTVRANDKLDRDYGTIISVSEYTKKYWLETSKRPEHEVKVLKNGIDCSKFNKKIEDKEKQELKELLGLRKEDFVVLYCGRICAEKGVKELINAILLTEKRIKLLVIGSSNFGVSTNTPYEVEIANLIQKNSERIRFTGYIPNEELYKYYHLADVAVLPSMWEEACGLVLLEYMTVGKSTIITNSGGAVEFVNSKTSIIVNKENNVVNQLAEKIKFLSENPEVIRFMEKEALIQSGKFTAEKYYVDFLKLLSYIESGE